MTYTLVDQVSGEIRLSLVGTVTEKQWLDFSEKVLQKIKEKKPDESCGERCLVAGASQNFVTEMFWWR